MFRSEAQLARACWALCQCAGIEWAWTTDGPTAQAIALLDTGGGPLSSGERVVLLTAWAFWNGATQSTLADVVYRLDDNNLRAIATLMLAIAQGEHAIDDWIAAMENQGPRSRRR